MNSSQDPTDVSPTGPSYRYRFDNAEFDESRFELKVDGHVVAVQRKPLEILQLLLRLAGEVVTREELLNTVWAGTVTVDNVVANAMSKLRIALGPAHAGRILTQPRVGYRFSGPLERMVVGKVAAAPLTMQPGEPVAGRPGWILSRPLARTAASEVWLATRQRDQLQHVFKFSASGQQLTLLKREVTVSRLLESALGRRPDLTQVVSWNFEHPPFFLESAYFGETLTDWAERDGHLAALPDSRRIGLFLRIAQAVSAAHGVGVLHKDLKPANILVQEHEGQLEVRLNDFGSARLLYKDSLDALGITQLGMTLGDAGSGSPTDFSTPLYLAPELLQGALPSVRSDIYALGLILFQLVVGNLRQPLGPGWERSVDNPFLRDDIAMATDSAADQRFASVAALIEHIENLQARTEQRLQQEAAAQAAQLLEAAAARARARRPLVRGLILTLLVGLVVSLGLYGKAVGERAHARQEASRAEAINRFLNDDLLAAADPGKPGGVANPRMEDVLAAAERKLDFRFSTDLGTGTSIRATLGETYVELGNYPKAETALRKGLALAQGQPGLGAERARLDYDLCLVLLRQGRIDEAHTLLEQGDHDAGPEILRHSRLAIQAFQTRGNYFYERGDYDAAIRYLETAEWLRGEIANDDDKLRFRVELRLLDSYVMKRRYKDAEPLAAAMTAAAFGIGRVGVSNWANARVARGGLLVAMKRFDEATAVDREAVRVLSEQMGPRHFYTAYAMAELANIYSMQGRYHDARPLARQVAAVMRDSEGADSQNALLSEGNLGILAYQEGDPAAAVQSLSAVHAALLRQFGADNPQVQSTAFYLAASRSDLGQQAQAASLLTGLTVATLTGSSENDEHWEPRLRLLNVLIACRSGKPAAVQGVLTGAGAALAGVTPPDPLLTHLQDCAAHAPRLGALASAAAGRGR